MYSSVTIKCCPTWRWFSIPWWRFECCQLLCSSARSSRWSSHLVIYIQWLFVSRCSWCPSYRFIVTINILTYFNSNTFIEECQTNTTILVYNKFTTFHVLKGSKQPVWYGVYILSFTLLYTFLPTFNRFYKYANMHSQHLILLIDHLLKSC